MAAVFAPAFPNISADMLQGGRGLSPRAGGQLPVTPSRKPRGLLHGPAIALRVKTAIKARVGPGLAWVSPVYGRKKSPPVRVGWFGWCGLKLRMQNGLCHRSTSEACHAQSKWRRLRGRGTWGPQFHEGRLQLSYRQIHHQESGRIAPPDHALGLPRGPVRFYVLRQFWLPVRLLLEKDLIGAHLGRSL